MTVCWDVLGKRSGNFHPRAKQFRNESEFRNSMERLLLRHNRLRSLIVPNCGFTANIVNGDEERSKSTDLFVKSSVPADGAIVANPREGILFLTADCLTLTVFDEEAPRLAALHIGYRTLFREKKGDPNIIDTLFERFGFPPEKVSASIGHGIGPCCFGVKHHPPIPGIEYSIATAGPRRGQRSLDLRRVARQMLAARGVRDDAIRDLGECTSCAGRTTDHDRYGFFHSNVRDGSQDAGRNAVCVWFVD